MLEQALEMICFKPQTFLTPKKQNIKYCLKFLSINFRYCACDKTAVAWVTSACIIVVRMVILNRLSHIFQLTLLCVNTCDTQCNVNLFWTCVYRAVYCRRFSLSKTIKEKMIWNSCRKFNIRFPVFYFLLIQACLRGEGRNFQYIGLH
jgi:hypothetical protein